MKGIIRMAVGLVVVFAVLPAFWTGATGPRHIAKCQEMFESRSPGIRTLDPEKEKLVTAG